MRFPENYKVVPIASRLDLNGTATNPCDSINMKNYHRATFLCNFQALGVKSVFAKVWSGTTDGAQSSALTFNYAFGTATILGTDADVLAATASSANLEIADTYDDFMLVIEIDASAMDVASGEEWLTLCFPDTGVGATGNVSVFAILEPRYSKASSPTALA